MSASRTENNQLQGLLIEPREDLDVEIKSWISPADPVDEENIAKALLALANHGGGHLVFGFREKDGGWETDANRPDTLAAFNQDDFNALIARYAEPVFHCRMHLVEHPKTKGLHPVVVVPGVQKVPVRAKRSGPDVPGKRGPTHVSINCYYIRRPGPQSGTPQTGQEWDALIQRCVRASRDELLSHISSLLSGQLPQALVERAVEPPDPSEGLRKWKEVADSRRLEVVKKAGAEDAFKHGVWSCAYLLEGPARNVAVQDFLSLLHTVRGHETGWPPWWVPTRHGIRPTPYNGMVECWIGDSGDPAHMDYWLASPDSRMYLGRGYQEDSTDRLTPGSAFDLTLPVWRVAECLLHAHRLAEAVAEQGAELQARMEFRWTGLAGRTLTAWASPMRSLSYGRTATQDEVVSGITVAHRQILPNLADLTRQITKPLYGIFDFFEPRSSLATEEINTMLGRR